MTELSSQMSVVAKLQNLDTDTHTHSLKTNILKMVVPEPPELPCYLKAKVILHGAEMLLKRFLKVPSSSKTQRKQVREERNAFRTQYDL